MVNKKKLFHYLVCVSQQTVKVPQVFGYMNRTTTKRSIAAADTTIKKHKFSSEWDASDIFHARIHPKSVTTETTGDSAVNSKSLPKSLGSLTKFLQRRREKTEKKNRRVIERPVTIVDLMQAGLLQKNSLVYCTSNKSITATVVFRMLSARNPKAILFNKEYLTINQFATKITGRPCDAWLDIYTANSNIQLDILRRQFVKQNRLIVST